MSGYAMTDKRECYASLAAIAEQRSLSPSTISRHQKRLAAMGYLEDRGTRAKGVRRWGIRHPEEWGIAPRAQRTIARRVQRTFASRVQT